MRSTGSGFSDEGNRKSPVEIQDFIVFSEKWQKKFVRSVNYRFFVMRGFATPVLS